MYLSIQGDIQFHQRTDNSERRRKPKTFWTPNKNSTLIREQITPKGDGNVKNFDINTLDDLLENR